MVSACRFCDSPLRQSFCDLGETPLSNAYLRPDDDAGEERYFPLHARVCGQCFLVQVPEFESPQGIFSDYAYFSSYSDSWLAHAKRFSVYARQCFGLDASSLVIEVASNDGYLLQYFQAEGIPVLGIEPAENVARVAEAKGVATRQAFFGTALAEGLAEEGVQADLLVGNNVLAHVPDLNDFVAGLKLVLADAGIISMEFPHLLRLIEQSQFDTIYHEHFSYFSLTTAALVFQCHGLKIFDVEELPTHGGSLRIFACHAADSVPVSESVEKLLQIEQSAGLADLSTYTAFQRQADAVKQGLLEFLERADREGKQVAGYGAPAKGNTLLNFCSIGADQVNYTVDRNPHKQGTRLPGSGIPVFAPEKLAETRPDYVLVLPWNLKDEIVEQMGHISEWGGKFVVPIPALEVIP